MLHKLCIWQVNREKQNVSDGAQNRPLTTVHVGRTERDYLAAGSLGVGVGERSFYEDSGKSLTADRSSEFDSGSRDAATACAKSWRNLAVKKILK